MKHHSVCGTNDAHQKTTVRQEGEDRLDRDADDEGEPGPGSCQRVLDLVPHRVVLASVRCLVPALLGVGHAVAVTAAKTLAGVGNGAMGITVLQDKRPQARARDEGVVAHELELQASLGAWLQLTLHTGQGLHEACEEGRLSKHRQESQGASLESGRPTTSKRAAPFRRPVCHQGSAGLDVAFRVVWLWTVQIIARRERLLMGWGGGDCTRTEAAAAYHLLHCHGLAPGTEQVEAQQQAVRDDATLC
mmetsp:Transcript_5334/g.15454  ORF Transcript_5334/g.15454 Transcript_5334/m.15454 type:complete len:247 (-) Transcript_5334:656-1396(-)